jgi:hypothetical protein
MLMHAFTDGFVGFYREFRCFKNLHALFISFFFEYNKEKKESKAQETVGAILKS